MGDFVGRMAASPDATLQGGDGAPGGPVYVIGGTSSDVDSDGGFVQITGGIGGATSGAGGGVSIGGGPIGGGGAGGVSLSIPGGPEVNLDPDSARAVYYAGSIRLAAQTAMASKVLLLHPTNGLTLDDAPIGTQAAFVANGSTVDQLRDALIASGLMAAS